MLDGLGIDFGFYKTKKKSNPDQGQDQRQLVNGLYQVILITLDRLRKMSPNKIG